MNVISALLAARSERYEYKVWVTIERITLHHDGYEDYQDVGLPDPLAVCRTLSQAQAFVRGLPGWEPEGSDHRE
jgi:hypothetical protein